MKIIGIILAWIIAGAVAFAEIRVEQNENEILIYIDNLQYEIIKGETGSVVFIRERKVAKSRQIGGLALESPELTLAVPNFDLQAEAEILKTRSFAGFRPAAFCELYPTRFEKKPLPKLAETLSPKTEIEALGVSRGVKIARFTFYPYKYDKYSQKLEIVESAIVRIPLKYKRKIANRSLNKAYSPLSAVDNPAYIEYYSGSIENIGKDAAEKQNADWHDPETHYLKISTSKDGVAKIFMADALEKAPQWRGRASRGLKLVYRGDERKIYLDDEDGVIDDGDELYFLGSRPAFDTTWFDNYNTKAFFYLYYDENSPGDRFELFEKSPASAPFVESVSIDKHIEYETEYWNGKLFLECFTAPNEGWYWASIDQRFRRKFNYEAFFIPSPSPSDSIEITLDYVAMVDTTFVRPNPETEPNKWVPLKAGYQYDFVFNGLDSAITDKLELIYRRNIGGRYSANRFFAGLNDILFTSNPVDTLLAGATSVDFIEARGKAAPVAFRGESDFSVEPLAQKSGLRIQNFSGSQVAGFELENGKIVFPDIAEGAFASAGARTGISPYATLAIGDSVVSSNKAGFHFASLASPNFNNFEYKYFASFDGEARNYIENLPEGSILSAAINIEGEPSDGAVATFESLGSSFIENLGEGEAFSFVCVVAGASSENVSANISNSNQFFNGVKAGYCAAEIPLETNKKYRFVFNDSARVETARIENVPKSNLKGESEGAELIVVSHSNFTEQAEALAEYRAARLGVKSITVDVENIYKEYDYGRKSPEAIRDFLSDLYRRTERKPEYLILFGDASWDVRKILPESKMTDFVPSFGLPVSDYWYGLIDGDDKLPEVVVGRIPVKNSDEANAYIEKIFAYDAAPRRPWMKKFLFLSGGYNDNEKEIFYEALEDLYLDFIITPALCADTATARKRDDDYVGETEAREIREKINAGALWVNYLGHSSPNVFDMDGWQVETLNNIERYSIFTALSCNSGAFALHYGDSRNEMYALEPRKGFIATMGATGTSWADIDKIVLYWMIATLADEETKTTRIGDMLYFSKSKLGRGYENDRTKYQFALLGDPTMDLKISKEPDLYIIPEEIQIDAQSEGFASDEDDFFTVKGIVRNGGYCEYDSVEVAVSISIEGKIDSLFARFDGVCLKDSFEIQVPIEKKAGTRDISIIIDPFEKLTDPDRENNVATGLKMEVFSGGLLALDPLNYWDVDLNKPVFRYVNPLAGDDDIEHMFEIFSITSGQTAIIKKSEPEEITIDENYAEWSPDVELADGETYLTQSYYINHSKGGIRSATTAIEFYPSSSFVSDIARWRADEVSEFDKWELDDAEILGDDDAEIAIFDEPLDFSVLSVSGNANSSRFIDISAGGKVYARTFFNRGFNVLAISIYSGDAIFRRYDTWDYEGDSTTSERFVRFIRDTLTSDYYLFLGVCDRSFRTQYMVSKENPGYIDSVLAALKLYGAEYADSLDFDDSYALASRKGASFADAYEAINDVGDTAFVAGTFHIFKLEGEAVSELFGPAKQWLDISISGSSGASSTMTLSAIPYDRRKRPAPDSENVSFGESGDFPLGVSAEQYPYMKLKLDLKRLDFTESPRLEEVAVKFKPTPEFAIVKSKSRLSADSPLRGYDNEYSVAVRNISRRTLSDSVRVDFSILTPQGEERIAKSLETAPLAPDESFEAKFPFSTRELDLRNLIFVEADPGGEVEELYRFNNSDEAETSVREDTTKPQIELLLDGETADDDDYVAIRPRVEVVLRDNSPLPIENENNLTVRINTYKQTASNTEEYAFEKINEAPGVKIRKTFTPDSLDFGVNIFAVYALDATGNRDTLKVRVKVSLAGGVEHLVNYPNPTSSETNFKFDYVGSNQRNVGEIQIYTAVGQLIRKISAPVKIGSNEMSWDALDSGGRSVPVGAYYYLVKIDASSYVEPVSGKIIISR